MNDPHEKNEQFAKPYGFTPVQHPNNEPLKHSGLGIASFVLALVSIASFVILSIVFVGLLTDAVDFTQIVDANGNRLMTDEELVEKIQPHIGFLAFYPFLLLMVLVGLILGIVGLARPGRKKVFAILGTVFNGLPLLFVLLLLVVGLGAGAA
ncbi:hypothetical protein [Cohnella boryungensis]|jgi:hypothetical protein|uniref:DUF4064 domain-containing protein n=1 Tax=Cohnella boryungensis TaxID=768479 RepID=A0ABV8SC47_9BACL